MNQIPFGQRAMRPPPGHGRDNQAIAVSAIRNERCQSDDGPGTGLMIAIGLATGFVIAAIECL
jgi:hypothetical protein